MLKNDDSRVTGIVDDSEQKISFVWRVFFFWSVFVAEINDPHIRYNRKNARLRLIFDNETEGNNLHRSFARKL